MTEFDFIRRVRKQALAHPRSPRVVAGIGDDASVINQPANANVVISTDLLVENVDFRRDATPPRLLGHKALAVSLSDIAAMGGRPRWLLLSIGLPREVWDTDFLDQFYEGFFALADRYGASLVGGDVSHTPDLIVIDSICVGDVQGGAEVRRSGARPGDQVFITGTLGGAAAGLKLIELGARLQSQKAGARGQEAREQGSSPIVTERGSSPTVREGSQQEAGARGQEAREQGSSPIVTERSSSPTMSEGVQGVVTEPRRVGVATGSINQHAARSETGAIEQLLLRHLRPGPRVGWGLVLGEERLASAMIDLSDGLSSDLAHLCRESNAGALIHSERLPIDSNVIGVCGRRALDPLLLALHGGEDFELLFTVRPSNAPRLPRRVDGVPISHIGEITDEPGRVRIAERDRIWDLEPGGFEHFK